MGRYKSIGPEVKKETWDLACAVGQRKAAELLGISQYGVQERMRSWARLAGIDLPGGRLPGLLTKEERASAHRDQPTLASLSKEIHDVEERLTERIAELERSVRRLRRERSQMFDHRRVADGGMTVKEQKRALRAIADGHHFEDDTG